MLAAAWLYFQILSKSIRGLGQLPTGRRTFDGIGGNWEDCNPSSGGQRRGDDVPMDEKWSLTGGGIQMRFLALWYRLGF